MCGIVGLLAVGEPGEDARRGCRRALELLRHRGPDHLGAVSLPNAELGHARLEIVDPGPAADQPLADTSGRWWIVHNGEIYNFPELRSELEGLGHRFATHGDAEVVLEAYKRWGRDCQRRFNGMWAFAIYDEVERELFLSRDRYGVKPLYVAEVNGAVAFASEMKALLALGASPQPDWVVISRILQGGIGDDGGDATVFRDVQAVPPGHDLLLRAGSTVLAPRRWWAVLEELEEVPGRYRNRVELLRERFGRSVALRLRSDAAVGVSLSGGIDSSAVYGAARQLEARRPLAGATLGGPMPRLRAYAVSNPGSGVDERRWVDACVEMWGSADDLDVVVPGPGLIPRLMEEVTWYQEAPVWSPTVLALHELYRRVASSGTRVLLEGHGADELFGGYVHHALAAVHGHARGGRPLAAWRAARCWRSMHQPAMGRPPASAFEALAAAWPDSVWLSSWRRRGGGAGVGRAGPFAGLVTTEVPHAWAVLAAFGREVDREPDRTLYVDFMRRLPSWFRIFDRATMASGVESRVPFMDPGVVQLAWSLPADDKIGGVSKRILRRAARGWIPDAVRRRTAKQPFAVPWWEWFADPDVHDFVLDLVRGRDFLECGWLEGGRVAAAAEEALRDPPSPGTVLGLWRVVHLFVWHRRFVDRGGEPPHLRPAPCERRALSRDRR